MAIMTVDTRLDHPKHQSAVVELAIDGNTPEGHPLGMFGGRYEEWGHDGPKVLGPQTLLAKWVELGPQPSFTDLLIALSTHGHMLEGQWLKAVKEQYRSDGVFDRAIADASWQRGGQLYIPVIRSDDLLLLRSISDGFHEHDRRRAYLWLVGVEEAQGN